MVPLLAAAENTVVLFAVVGAVAVNVSVPIVTVAPVAAIFVETLPMALAFVMVRSGIGPVVEEGVAVPLSPGGVPPLVPIKGN